MTDDTDNRQFVRYEMNNISEVNLSVPGLFGFGKGKNVKRGLILDISMAGMAIQYDGKEIPSLRAKHLSIVIPGKGTLIEGIPFQVVADFPIGPNAAENAPRRCGLKFGDLTDEQRNRLAFVVNSYSSKKAEKNSAAT